MASCASRLRLAVALARAQSDSGPYMLGLAVLTTSSGRKLATDSQKDVSRPHGYADKWKDFVEHFFLLQKRCKTYAFCAQPKIFYFGKIMICTHLPRQIVFLDFSHHRACILFKWTQPKSRKQLPLPPDSLLHCIGAPWPNGRDLRSQTTKIGQTFVTPKYGPRDAVGRAPIRAFLHPLVCPFRAWRRRGREL